ncbi:MAG: hypothetical protein ACOZNI_31100 [Myxococcota bacterium]
MRPGQRAAGRWELVRELTGGEDWVRWEVRDGEHVAELVAPKAHALLRPGAREAFAGTPMPDDPAVLPRLAEDEIDDVPVRVQARTRCTFLEARLSVAEARAIAGWLGPAVLAAGGACAGELTAEDLVVDADGVPRLAPLGIPRAESLARKPVYRAPDGGADGRADLFGLGVALHFAATGRLPKLPPSPVDPALDPVFAGLLSRDPDARVAALPPPPEEPPRLQPPAAPPAPAPIVHTPHDPLPRYVVVVPLRGLGPDALRRVAARAASDVAAVERAAARGAMWAVGGAETELDAGPLLKRLAGLGLPARAVTTVAPKVVQYWAVAVVVAVVGLVSGFLLPFGVAAGVLAWMGLINFRHMFPVAEARLAWQERRRAPADPASPVAKIETLRARIVAEDLHDAVAADLRARLADAERKLDAALLEGGDLGAVAGMLDAIASDLDRS